MVIDRAKVDRVRLSAGNWADVHPVAGSILDLAWHRQTLSGLERVRNAIRCGEWKPTPEQIAVAQSSIDRDSVTCYDHAILITAGIIWSSFGAAADAVKKLSAEDAESVASVILLKSRGRV